MSTKENTPYYTSRMQELGITDALNTFTYTYYQGDEPKAINQVVFEADEHDNIRINYYNLLGDHYRWKNDGAKWEKQYYRTRIKDPKEGAPKYLQEKGSGQFPFFPPNIIAKYAKKENIETLFVIEGEFKAFKGSMIGVDVIGIPSIHGFYNGDVQGKLHEDIQELIIQCKVKRVVFLTDADTMTVNWAADKDLSKRPLSFYTAVKYFRQSVQLLLDDKSVALEMVHWMYIETKYEELEAKGLDDLLTKFGHETEDIKADMLQFEFAKKYFRGFNISDGQMNKVYRWMGLGNETEFYQVYKKHIGSREFLFKKRRYHFDGEDVKFVKHEDADRFMRVGPDYLKIINVPNKHGDLETDLVPWKKSEITSDYKKYPDFLEQIPKYDAFCNEPSWNGSFKKTHNGCFNLCEPLIHVPKEGDFPTIRKFLKHVFSGQGDFDSDITGDQFTVGLDYLCIQLQHPKQMLPVPILVSPEFKTGKSTFLKWLQAVYGNNMAILGNEQFKMRFNAHYITKFIIAIDEGFLEVDKKQEKERLKQLATADTAYLENKGMNVKKFPYYGKLIICSNDADRVMKIDEGENRWFVVRVFPIEEEDPQLEQKMREEIPAWLHYAMHRKIHHKKETRLWFREEHFITDQFRIIVEETKNRLDRLIEDFIRDLFLTYRVTEINVGLKTLVNQLALEGTKYRIDREDIRNYLQKRKGIEPAPHPVKQSYPTGWADDNGTALTLITQKQRCYTLKYDDWLTDDEVSTFKIGEEAAHSSRENSGNASFGNINGGQEPIPF